jgi:acetylornithine deacetylase
VAVRFGTRRDVLHDGLIKGGVAPNVISPSADAEIMFRTVGDHRELRAKIAEAVGSLVTIDDVLVVPPERLTTVPGFDAAVFSFTTDIPFLDQWGAPLLLGPGSVTLAHTADEHVGITELHQSVESLHAARHQFAVAVPDSVRAAHPAILWA